MTPMVYSQVHFWTKMTFACKIIWWHIKMFPIFHYRQVANIRRTFVSNKIVDHSDVVEASPVGAAPTTSSFST